jgi:hypothetical protein
MHKKIQKRRKQAKEYDIWTSIMFLFLERVKLDDKT